MIRALLLISLLLAGCGAAPLRAPPFQQDGEHYAQQAAQAAQREDWASAGRLTQVALAYYASLDDRARRFDLLLNLALIEQQQGALERATAALNVAVPLAHSNAQQLRLRLRQASLALKRGERAAVEAALAGAERLCGPACPERTVLLNLRARQALADGAPLMAERFAAQAAQLAGTGGGEAANARRLQGQAALRQAQAARAIPLFEAALAIDRNLGASDRIGEDLEGLAAALRAAGGKAEADDAAERAQAWRLGRKAVGLPP